MPITSIVYKCLLDELINQSDNYTCTYESLKQWLKKTLPYYIPDCSDVTILKGNYDFPTDAQFSYFYEEASRVIAVLDYKNNCIRALEEKEKINLKEWKKEYAELYDSVADFHIFHLTDIDEFEIKIAKIPNSKEVIYLENTVYLPIIEFAHAYFVNI